MSPFDYGSYLAKIQDIFDVPGGSRPRKKDLPEKIQNELRSRRILKNLVSEIGRELNRATGRPVETRLLNEEILPEMKVILNSLEAIQRVVQREVPSEGRDTIPLTKLDQHIHQILDDYYHEAESSREILERISREVDPINSETSYFEDLPFKVALLVNKQASNHQASKRNDMREKRTLSSEQVESKDGREVGKKMKRHTNRVIELERSVIELERSVENYRRQEEETKNAPKEMDDLITKAYDRVEQIQTTVDAKQIEIDKLKATEIDLRQSQRSLEDALDEATRNFQTTLEAKQVEIQKLKAKEKRHGGQIEKLTAKHEGELDDQKNSIEGQHKAKMLAQRKKHDAEKKELQELYDAELKKQQKHAETLQAKLAEEVREHEHSWSEALKRTKEQAAQLIALERQHTQTLAEQRTAHSSALGRAEADKIEQLDVLREEHNRRITESDETWKQVVRVHDAEKIEWERALLVEEARSRRKVEEEAEKHKLVIEKLETELRTEKATTTKKVEEEAMKHKNTIEKLEMGRKKLLGMLLKQEEYPGLSDQEIVRGVTSKTGKVSIVGFSSMVSKVTTFSEWEWREDRKIWSKETLTALVGTKQRRLKKLILGDAIWTTVYQLIFCSPFRILGKEGEHLEADWNGSFPSGMIV